MADSLQNNIQYLKGVGEKRAARLNKLGVYTVADLLYLYPRRYVDYSAPLTVARAPFDENRAVKATVLQKMPGVRVKGGRTIFYDAASRHKREKERSRGAFFFCARIPFWKILHKQSRI